MHVMNCYVRRVLLLVAAVGALGVSSCASVLLAHQPNCYFRVVSWCTARSSSSLKRVALYWYSPWAHQMMSLRRG